MSVRPRKLECTGMLFQELEETFAIDCDDTKEVVLTVRGLADLEAIEEGIVYFQELRKIENIYGSWYLQVRMLRFQIYPMMDPLPELRELTVTVFIKPWAEFTGADYLIALLAYPTEWENLTILHLKMTPMENGTVTTELQNSAQWEQLSEMLMDEERFPSLFTVEIDVLNIVRDVHPWSDRERKDDEEVLGLTEVLKRERATRKAITEGLGALEMGRDLNISVSFEREYGTINYN
ncbi:hypothetical protein F5877DRAFT_73626 [Lentinula edodes]|nr:hypothetical protein F5877DRAFT_73626 [Lentinula edodes]